MIVIDVGNTNIVIGFYTKNKLIKICKRIRLDYNRFIFFNEIFKQIRKKMILIDYFLL